MEDVNKPKHEDVKEYSETTKSLFPKELNSRHRALMRQLAVGVPLKEAAEVLGFSIQRASLVSNSPLFKEEMSKMEGEIRAKFVDSEGSALQGDEVRKYLMDNAKKAAEKLVKLQDGATNERVQQASAIEILDRTGYGKVEEIKGKVTIEVGEGLENMLKRAISEMKGKPSEGAK